MVMVGNILSRSSGLSRYGKFILLNESVSWTPDLITPLKRDISYIDRIFNGDENELETFFHGHKSKMRNFIKFREMWDLKEIENDLEKMANGGITLFTMFDDDYPERLKRIGDPPLVLYHIGTVFDMSRCVAVSGTRNPGSSIRKKTFHLSCLLAEAGYTVTSGLAKGIDTYAHQGALSYKDGNSVAIMANGLDRVVPRSNLDLARRIASRGAVLSEKTLRSEPSRYDFIRRNRMISGLSGLQIIMQSSGTGGTEHQFRISRDQGKPVLVYNGPDLPGPSKRSASRMISKGAKEFETVNEVVELVRKEWGKEISYARGEDISLENWN